MDDDLLDRLEYASCGNRELDARILATIEDRDVFCNEQGRLLGRSRQAPYDTCLLLYEDGRVAGMRPELPNFSTSVDAAIPGEDIMHVQKEVYSDGTRWSAVDSGGGSAEASTEALARRLAALLSRFGKRFARNGDLIVFEESVRPPWLRYVHKPSGDEIVRTVAMSNTEWVQNVHRFFERHPESLVVDCYARVLRRPFPGVRA